MKLVLTDKTTTLPEITYTESQAEAVRLIKEFFEKGTGLFWLAGGAGTGKSTITPYIIKELGLLESDVLVCAPTNKAKAVLAAKGFSEVSTIHKAIKSSRISGPGADRFKALSEELKGVTDAKKDRITSIIKQINELATSGEVWWESVEDTNAGSFKLILVDEASMASDSDIRELEKIGCPILLIGDNNQLPPVGETGFIAVHEPDHILTQNMRQKESNGNIIAASVMVREQPKTLFNTLPYNEWKERSEQSIIKVVDPFKLDRNVAQIQFLAHSNDVCFKHIASVRKDLPATPVAGDRLLSYTTQNAVIKGQIYNVVDCENKNGILHLNLIKEDDGTPIMARTPASNFNKSHSNRHRLELLGHSGVGNIALPSFYYANCITIHKSQGSEWETVGVYLPKSNPYRPMQDDDLMRLKYTAITRAKKELILVVT